MRSIHPLRLGITCSALTLIACVIWFAATDQAGELRRRAFEAREQSLAAARATEKGVSVGELRHLASVACPPYAPPNPGKRQGAPPTGGFLNLWREDEEIASRPSIEECVNNYIYGDALMYEPTADLFREWLFAVLEIVFISVAAGAAMAAIFKLMFYSWRPHTGHKSLILLNRGEDFAKM